MNDKSKHFWAAAGITIATLAIFAIVPHGNMWGYDKAIALALGVVAGGAKELIWDKWLGRGTPEFDDFLYSLWGAFAAMFSWAIVETIIQVFKYGF